MSIRAIVGGEGFAKLIAGKMITVLAYNKEMQTTIEVELILSDIGFAAMANAVRQAELRQHSSDNWRGDANNSE